MKRILGQPSNLTSVKKVIVNACGNKCRSAWNVAGAANSNPPGEHDIPVRSPPQKQHKPRHSHVPEEPTAHDEHEHDDFDGNDQHFEPWGDTHEHADPDDAFCAVFGNDDPEPYVGLCE
jgi:hypothetical protein